MYGEISCCEIETVKTGGKGSFMLLCMVRTSPCCIMYMTTNTFLPLYSVNKGLSSELIRIICIAIFFQPWSCLYIMKWNGPLYCRFRPKFTNVTPDWGHWAWCGNLNRTGRSWMACKPNGLHPQWQLGMDSADWECVMVVQNVMTNKPTKVIVRVGGLFPNFLEFYPIVFPNGTVKKGISWWL